MNFLVQSVEYAISDNDDPAREWIEKASVAVPLAVCALSSLILLVHLLFRFLHLPNVQNRHGKGFKAHVESHGGWIIFISEMVRGLGCLASAALSAALVLQEDHTTLTKSPFGPLLVTFTYTSFLSTFQIFSRPPSSFSYHLPVVSFTAFLILFVRDIIPLCTFTQTPLDTGPLVWSLIAVQSVVSVILPPLTPRIYIPLDPQDPMTPNPTQTSSILSLSLFSFLDSLILKAYRIPKLTLTELPPLADDDHIKHLVRFAFGILDPHHEERKPEKKQYHIFFKLFYVFRREYLIIAVLLLLYNLALLATPYGLKGLLTYLQTEGEGAIIRPWVWIATFFFAPLLSSIFSQQNQFRVFRITTRVEAIITQLVLEHAFRIRLVAETPRKGDGSGSATPSGATTPVATGSSPESVTDSQTTLVPVEDGGAAANKAQALVGRMNNLISTDLQAISRAADFMELLVSVPIIIVGCIIFLYLLLGWSALVGFLVMLIQMPLPAFVGKLLQGVSRDVSKKGDDRIETVTETMSVIRMIKMFGWERRMSKRVGEKREAELKAIFKSKVYGFISMNFSFMIPAVTMAVTYAIYALVQRGKLDAATVFASLSLFDLLRYRTHVVFWAVPNMIRGKVSLERISDFLNDTELLDKHEPQDTTPLFPSNDSTDIGFREADFTWSKETDNGKLTPSKRHFKLHVEQELLFKPGCINLVFGPTGCGKTSLLMALLGEMHFVPATPNSWFNLPRAGGVAYAAQESWVMNATIKDNIIFGASLDAERYDQVIYQCGLTRDLSLFEAGDLTEVGEKGLTLSGGQKARVTLARAIYSSAAILLLDDILAALDVHTAKWIVEKCLEGDLVRGRTVIIVTHNVHMVSPVADFVVAMGSGGQILSQGSIADALAQNPGLNFEAAKQAEMEDKAKAEIDPAAAGDARKEADGRLIVEEEVADGHISFSSVTMYISALGGKYPSIFWIGFCSATVFECFVEILQPWILGAWATEYQSHPPEEVDVAFYISGYIGLVLLMLVVFCTAQLFLVKGALRASQSLHDRLVDRMLGTTLRWLDKTPTSRVLTRCTQDVAAIDTTIPDNMSQVFEAWVIIMLRYFAVLYFAPVFGLLGIIILASGATIGNIYMKSQLSVKREMSKAKAPVLAHFGAAIEGLTSIRAYGAEESIRLKSMGNIDNYSRASRVYNDLSRWVGIRITLLGEVFAVCLGSYFVYANTGINPSNSGFLLTLTVSFGNVVMWFVQSLNQFEVNGNSLERIQEYMGIEQEKEWSESAEPPAYWPASGRLSVEGLSAKYSADGPRVLHDLTFDVKAGERIGIVGKTGSGKSTLALSLFRCIPTDGEVYYDGIPTSTVNLDALRKQMTIIPQIPELLSGTLRQNLDPFDQYDDNVLNNALRSAGLYSLQVDDESKERITLESVMSRGGGNLSVGQRQIIALARAMVRESKLLILDEATSAIDYKTDAVIQESLRTGLKKDVTVITIAHRLQTIMDADKIMVLDAGKMVEYDAPKNLLAQKNGFLHALVEESGDKEALYAAARLSTVTTQHA